jgi:hypothetical protein
LGRLRRGGLKGRVGQVGFLDHGILVNRGHGGIVGLGGGGSMALLGLLGLSDRPIGVGQGDSPAGSVLTDASLMKTYGLEVPYIL